MPRALSMLRYIGSTMEQLKTNQMSPRLQVADRNTVNEQTNVLGLAPSEEPARGHNRTAGMIEDERR